MIVLVVDSDPVGRFETAQALITFGHNVIQVADAEEATQVLEAQCVNVIVTELRLPGVHGELFALSLKHGWGDVGIVALAGIDKPSTRVRCGYAQIDVFLRKTYLNPWQLDRAVRAAAARRVGGVQRRGA